VEENKQVLKSYASMTTLSSKVCIYCLSLHVRVSWFQFCFYSNVYLDGPTVAAVMLVVLLGSWSRGRSTWQQRRFGPSYIMFICVDGNAKSYV